MAACRSRLEHGFGRQAQLLERVLREVEALVFATIFLNSSVSASSLGGQVHIVFDAFLALSRSRASSKASSGMPITTEPNIWIRRR